MLLWVILEYTTSHVTGPYIISSTDKHSDNLAGLFLWCGNAADVVVCGSSGHDVVGVHGVDGQLRLLVLLLALLHRGVLRLLQRCNRIMTKSVFFRIKDTNFKKLY